MFVYLDDILIFSQNLAEHQSHVRQVLQRLLENKLFVKAEKCDFHSSKVSFLGFIIESGKVKADPEKIKAIIEWPIPDNRDYRDSLDLLTSTGDSLEILVKLSHP